MIDIAREAGDSFDQAFRGHQVQILRTAYRMMGNWADAEDVAQEVFVRLHRHGLGFPHRTALDAWLYRVTVNLCLDRLRSRRPLAELADLPSGDASIEAVVLSEERKRRLSAALAMLPPRERAAVVLREIEGLSSQDVAAILGSTEGTVRSQVSKAIARLRGILMREES